MNLPAKITLMAFCLALAGGCTNTVSRATPAEMRAAPGVASRLTTPTAYDRAYSTTLEQVKACFEHAMGSASTAAYGDKSDREATVSLGLTSVFRYRILATISLTPIANGTDVALYAANEVWHNQVKLGLIEWLINGSRKCPDDVATIDTTDRLPP